MSDSGARGGRDITKYALNTAEGLCEALNDAVERGVMPRAYSNPEGVAEIIRSIAQDALKEPECRKFDPALCMAINQAATLMIEHPCADNGYRYVAREGVGAVFVDERPKKGRGRN